ncbi:ABC transporter permease [Micromonospora sp. NPDC049799]|uniref:ABC transporter permease n=1 Tax=Micromonospora sp. NPDC049799 TaxID=3154741 RepID=UPI0033C2F105
MTTQLDPPPVATSPPPVTRRRPGMWTLVAVLAAHGVRAFLRTPVAALFTLGLPVLFLVIIGALFGNEIVEPRQGIRVAQFFTPVLAVFGVAEAAFCVLAVDTALLRERGVLLRLRGTPVPPWAVLAARVCAAAVFALLAVVLVIGLGVLAYDVQLIGRTALAATVTVLLGVACFAALGVAVVSLVRSSTAAQAFTNGILIPLAFISDVFTISERTPTWLETVGWVFPLKHFANALADAFNPFLPGNGFAGDHLAVLALWTVAALAVARRRFRWAPTGDGRSPAPVRGGLSTSTASEVLPRSLRRGRPTPWASVAVQVGYALRVLSRDGTGVFFAVVFPVLLVALLPALMAETGEARTEAAQVMLPAMTAYGVAIVCFVTIPSGVAEARERGVLRRMRGTPMPEWAYVAGRVGAMGAVVATIAALSTTVAVTGYGVDVRPARLPALVAVLAIGTGCFGALGFALLGLARRGQTVTAVALGTLLPLGFISDVFVVGAQMPAVLATVGDVLPLTHLVHALDDTLAGTAGSAPAWGDLAVLAAWGAAGLIVVAVTARRATLIR